MIQLSVFHCRPQFNANRKPGYVFDSLNLRKTYLKPQHFAMLNIATIVNKKRWFTMGGRPFPINGN